MSTKTLAVRIDRTNPDHHLWRNRHTWWCHYTVHDTPITKQRIRISLKTRVLAEARKLRDQVFEKLYHEGKEVVA